MQKLARIFLLVAMAVAAFLLALEGGTTPLTPASLKRPPSARETAQANSELALDRAVGLATDLLRGQGYRQFSTAVYALPAGTAWPPIAGFYAEQLAATGWQPADEALAETPGRSIWARGLVHREALVVVLVSRSGSAANDYLLLLAAR